MLEMITEKGKYVDYLFFRFLNSNFLVLIN